MPVKLKKMMSVVTIVNHCARVYLLCVVNLPSHSVFSTAGSFGVEVARRGSTGLAEESKPFPAQKVKKESPGDSLGESPRGPGRSPPTSQT